MKKDNKNDEIDWSKYPEDLHYATYADLIAYLDQMGKEMDEFIDEIIKDMEDL